MEHPYIKYAIALIMEQRKYQSCEQITTQDIANELIICRNRFSMRIIDDIKGNGSVLFDYSSNEPNYFRAKVENNDNIIVAPHIISSNIKKAYAELNKLIDIMGKKGKENNATSITKALFPIGGEYFNPLSSKSTKANAKLTIKEYALIAITSLTEKKPCSSKFVKKILVNTCVIPDISIEATKDYVSIFNRLLIQKSKGFFKGKVTNDGKNNEVERPPIYSGNYANAAKSSYLQSLSVLGYIGELAKEEEYSMKALKVLEELKMNPVLLIDSGSELASIIHYSHFIIELAKEGSLNKIIDRLYYIKFYKFKGLKRTDSIPIYKDKGIKIEEKDIEYEKFDYYVSKFLTLFNHCTFNEFLSCRVEYPSEIRTILTLYFNNMEQISKDVIASAEAFGAWINRCSFIAAKNDSFPNRRWEDLAENEKQKIVEKKYKFLVELESSVFSSDNNRSMISNIITRVGRLSNTDVPQEAALFVKAVVEPSIDIGTAKNLVIAFSRIHSKGDDYKQVNNNSETQTGETIDSSNI